MLWHQNFSRPVRIRVRTARRWFKKRDMFTSNKAGLYFDGHEREDVKAYRKDVLLQWKNRGWKIPALKPQLPDSVLPLVLVTYP